MFLAVGFGGKALLHVCEGRRAAKICDLRQGKVGQRQSVEYACRRRVVAPVYRAYLNDKVARDQQIEAFQIAAGQRRK